jgi:hypothetical protein
MSDYLLVPAGLDIWGVLPTKYRRKHYVDDAALILHRVTTGSYYKNQDRWTGIGSREGAVLAGHRRIWEAGREAFLSRGVIECDGEAERGRKTFDYRLTDRWANAPLERYRLDPTTGQDLLDRLAKARETARTCEPQERHPSYDHFERWLQPVLLDEADARRVIDRMPPGESRQQAERVAEILIHADPSTRKVAPCRYGRAHHILTQSHGELRDVTTINGERLSCADVRNAQPLAAGVGCQHWWDATHKRTTDARPREATGRAGSSGGQDKQQSLRVPKSAPILRMSDYPDYRLCTYPSDLVEYIGLCAMGVYYDALADTLEITDGTVKSRRERAKEQSNWILMGEPPLNSPQWIRFSRRWPTMASYLIYLKTENGLPDEDKYKHASHTFQRTESDIMIRGAGNVLRCEHPDVPVVPVHDAILTPAWGMEAVTDVIRDEWRHKTGVDVTLKISRPA